MSYRHIENLYKDQSILEFKECYAMEKIHGTSAHIGWRKDKLIFSSGGGKHESFVALFDAPTIEARFHELGLEDATIYGESYGGKLQGMSKTYGTESRFVAFEVKIGEHWLAVPQAEDFAKGFGLDFVHYVRIPTELSAIDAERDADSVQAVRNGVGEGKLREGIVLRPLTEYTRNNGARVLVKHKRAEFAETKTTREVSPEKMIALQGAKAIAEEWVTEMRLAHVLDGFREVRGHLDMTMTSDLIKRMIEDVQRESEGEVVWSQDVAKQIGSKTAQMFKQRLSSAVGTS